MTYAIPTKWNGVQFRSRLEARWAAFFTAIGWEWSYEPVDLQGYIPDFLLHLHEDVLVEVKPFTRLEDPVIAEAHEKIRESGWVGSGVVVGARLFDAYRVPKFPSWSNVFVLGQELDEGPCPLGWCSLCGKASLSLWSLARRAQCGCMCSVCGEASWISFCGEDGLDRRKRVFGAWNEAGNAVQWRRRA